MTNRTNIGTNGFLLPEPQNILGTMFNGKPNFMALAWATRLNYKPCLMGIGVNKGHASHKAIVATKEFSLNIPSVNQVVATDYVGLASGNRSDKSEVFDIHFGELANAPLISDCPVSMELRLVQTVDMPTNTMFIGEVTAVWTEDRFMTDGYIDVEKVQPFTLTMPDNRYWAVGAQVGRAWHDGKALKRELQQENG